MTIEFVRETKLTTDPEDRQYVIELKITNNQGDSYIISVIGMKQTLFGG